LGTLSAQLSRLAASSEALLLMGETGTGKEIAARHVHAMSMRSGPLIAVDCGALPEQLVESTLFGHDKGAFTGATEARVGDIVRADRGTLFLDELGNLSPSAQAKLLRVLETKMVRPVGGRDSTRVDVRFVAATNAELDDAEFRSDLRFRLSGFVARLPALRKRKEDLGLLIRSLLSESGVIRARISRSAAQKLVSHSFPGNIRQLRGVLRSAAVLHAKDGALDIDVEALDMLDARAPHPHEAASTPLVSTRGKAPDRDALQAALIASRGNVAAAARDLRTSARQLYRWLAREDIDPETFRPSEHREPSAG
jgi:transcriptional regulator with GAF, ATPase, and Fis domain